ALDRPPPCDLTAEEPIEDGGIGLEAHAVPQAVDEYRRDPVALAAPGFLLDDRGENDGLLPGLQREVLLALGPGFFHEPAQLCGHALEDRLPRGAPLQDERFGQQGTLWRRRRDVA